MGISAAVSDSFQLLVENADGVNVINKTVRAGSGSGAESKDGCSSTGTAGKWTMTIKLTDFDGDGSYSLSKGC
jgi:hypothetical protein